jgi:type I restriction enzyme R subunit
MPSNKETLFQDHIAQFLETEHGYNQLEKSLLPNKKHHIIEPLLFEFIKATQAKKFAELEANYKNDSEQEIIKALIHETTNKPLWLVMRNGLDVKGTKFELYKPKPRSKTSSDGLTNYEKNNFTYKTEYYYHQNTQERIDLVIWLNGLPIIVTELKHEDEGQTVVDAISDSFLNRDLSNGIYRHPFLYVAASNVDVKAATNLRSEKSFRWFNAQLINKAETKGEYPVEHLYRHALSKESIAHYLEHFLVFVPAKEVIDEVGVVHSKESFTIFPRYHQLRASQHIAQDIKNSVNESTALGLKYLINHSAGSGKTLTMAWMADQLDSLYTDNNEKIFDNIVILTDRKSLDKNIKDELENFTHLKASKVNIAKRSTDLAKHLDDNRDIIVSTIHKFGYIQDKLKDDDKLKTRKIAFLIDEAHRSQEGKMALKMHQFFTKEGEAYEQEEDEPTNNDDIADKLKNLDISNQVFVAFTATTTPKTVNYFGEPFDIYSEAEAIEEGYILDVAQNIISYETQYNLLIKQAIPDNEYPAGVVSKMLKTLAFNDEELIQYKSEIIVKTFIEHTAKSINGKGKAMVVTSSRPAGLLYYQTIKTILEKKELPYKVLYAFSDYTDSNTGESIEEVSVNNLSANELIEDVFDTDDYRLLIVANKFQTGFDQPLLSTMFLDKAVNGVNAVQTVSRLNRMHSDKDQDDIYVLDFTNNSQEIFKAFNQHRDGSPYTEKEPDKSSLDTLYADVINAAAFTPSEIANYVTAYGKAEEDAKGRQSKSDALLSNINQEYYEKFIKNYPVMDEQKIYVAMLNRYTKLYYFIAQFFDLEPHLHEFVVFAEVMPNTLIKSGKSSSLSKLLKHIEMSKGAVNYKGAITNPNKKPKTSSGGGSGGNGIPKTTIQQAIEDIEQTYQISQEDALIIREVCEEVSVQEEIKTTVLNNRQDHLFLENYEATVNKKVTASYIERELWDSIDDPIYNDKGGIFAIMSKTVITSIASGI